MIGDLKPYSAYKDSGVPWLGEVPEHWELVPNRALLRKRKVLVGERHSEYQLLSLTKAGVIVRDVSTGRGKFSADMGTSQEVRRGDLVFCLFDIPETPRTVGLAKHDGMITGAYTVFECRNNQLARFIESFYIAMDDQKLLSPLYSGLRNTIPPSVFLGVKTPVLPAEEQTQIATFLDYADRRIRRYIRSKQKLIKLLEEQKQVIINQAVTRGLDPNVPLKPSSIEWLGDIPKHWEVSKLKFLFKEIDDRTTSGTEVLLSLRMYRGLVPHEEVSEKPITSDALIGYKKVKPRQLVMNRMRAAIGMFAVVDQPGLVSPDYAIFEHRRFVDPSYFLHLFKTSNLCSIFRLESKGLGTGSSGFMRLYTDRFGIIQVPLPPHEEQITIAREVETVIRDFHLAKDRVEREISLLHEFRTRLIADVVTGKLDVREAAAHLPVEVDDPEPLDDDLPEEDLGLDNDSEPDAAPEDEAA
jgi:type I restriction enzyme S subunit